MRKFAALFCVVVLVSCGNSGKNDEKEPKTPQKNVFELSQSNFYNYTFVTPDREIDFGFGIHVPDGYKIDIENFKKDGSLYVVEKDNITRYGLLKREHKGTIDAQTFFDKELRDGSMINFQFDKVSSQVEETGAYPSEEDYQSCNITRLSASYMRKFDTIDISGEVFVTWFDVIPSSPMEKPKGMGFVAILESKTSEWETTKQKLDLIMRSYIRLPSRSEIQTKLFRTKDKLSPPILAKNEFEYILLQLQAGAHLGPSIETLFKGFVPAYDGKDYFLVRLQQTASGLLPHPTKQGMTINPDIPSSLFDYTNLPSTENLKK